MIGRRSLVAGAVQAGGVGLAIAGLIAVQLLAAPQARAQDQAPSSAVMAEFARQSAGYPFLDAALSPQTGGLVVKTAKAFAEGNPAEQGKWVDGECSAWIESIRATGARVQPTLTIVNDNGGAYWSCNAAGANKITEWDDRRPPFTGDVMTGSLFMSIGGQVILGPTKLVGANFAEGISLYKTVFDMAFAESLSNDAAGDFNCTLGLTARVRIPVAPVFSVSLGLAPSLLLSIPSLSSSSSDSTVGPSLSTYFVMGFLGGFNINVPTGTVDIIGTVTTRSTYGLVLGHTFFFNSP